MAAKDSCCTLVPYFNVHQNKMDEFKKLCEQFVDKTANEEQCMFYGFSFSGDKAHCREGYQSAEGLLAHLDNVGDILNQALQIADIDRLEVHGPEAEVDKLREPLKDLNPQFFVLEYGFRK